MFHFSKVPKQKETFPRRGPVTPEHDIVRYIRKTLLTLTL